jgi:hypothetical protein
MVKKYRCDNCDYTFETLKENMPKALTTVKSSLGTSDDPVDGCLQRCENAKNED